jgi:cytosine/adenosine deaminase-related metal-dependent hydrolase
MLGRVDIFPAKIHEIALLLGMRKLRSDWMLTDQGLWRDAVLELDAEGLVTELRPAGDEDATAEYLPGLICPAFVNAHCHLELSHLKGMIPRGTGMAGFIGKLMGIRSTPTDEERAAAIREAAQSMYDRGISAVGDICNGETTLPIKASMPEIDWFNFIEVFGSNPGRSEEIFHTALRLLPQMGKRSSITLHAPYSVSKPLRNQILDYAKRRGWLQSIHLLESKEERQLFADLEGPLLDHLRNLGLAFQGHTHASPAEYILERYPENVPGLLVHNTEMTAGEISDIAIRFPHMRFVLCPLANDFIHGTCPPANDFAGYADRVCIGTDSLAGNERLDIFSEIQHLQQKTELSTEMLLQMATVNGAMALQLPREKYELAPGNTPHLLHLSNFKKDDPALPAATDITRIIP